MISLAWVSGGWHSREMWPPGPPLIRGLGWGWRQPSGWQKRGRGTSRDGVVWTRTGLRAMVVGPRGLWGELVPFADREMDQDGTC